MSIINSQPLIGAAGQSTGGYQIARSLRFNSADSTDLNRTFSTPTDNNRCTISLWIKKTTNSAGPLDFGFLTTGVNISVIGISGTGAYGASLDNKIFIRNNDTNKDYWYPVLRDNSAWYHIFIAINTDESTQADRAKLWINGVSQASNKQASGFSLSEALTFNTDSTVHRIGSIGSSYPTYYSNGYLTEYYFIDGQALTPSDFGETDSATGVWKPKAFSGTYGTNGFYLNFSDNSGTTSTTLGKDSSGNGNNWTPNNFSVTAGAGNDSLVDTPTSYGTDTGAGGEVRGNYATLNPLDKNTNITVANANLSYTTSSAALIRSTMWMTSGKYYAEFTISDATGVIGVGVAKATATLNDNPGIGDANAWGYVSGTGYKWNGGGAGVSYGSTFTANDVIGVAVDMTNGKIWWSKNGTWQASGDPAAGTNAAYTNLPTDGTPLAFAAGGNGGGAVGSAFNTGQRPFAYTAPSGYKALCTQNLPTPTIGATSSTQAGKYFNPVLYSSTGTNLSVTGVGFQPDLVWIKSRSSGLNHVLTDAVRGTTKELRTNSTNAESTVSTGVTSFDSDGFSIGTATDYNLNTATYVAWNWKANGSGSSNTAGSITSTVSANTTSGFSIATFTQLSGSPYVGTVGHGLGVAPSMVIIKDRSIANGWLVYHASLGATQYLILSSTAAAATGSNAFNNTAPTSTVFTTAAGSTYYGNAGATAVAYCFAPVAGYSAFGSYTGNGSTDGPFCFTNHRPAFVLIKRTDTTSNWTILDLQREGYNVDNDPLYPNLADAEGTADLADLLSNGFKLRSTDASVNANTGTYIYMSLASNPFKYSLGR